MTPLELATRLIGEVSERSEGDNPFIVWCHESTNVGHVSDEVPWCSSFVNRICWLLRLPRSKKANARSWLDIGIAPDVAEPGFDVVILKRGTNPLQGHVGFFAGYDIPNGKVLVVGGNQSNNVTLGSYPLADVLGFRRLK